MKMVEVKDCGNPKMWKTDAGDFQLKFLAYKRSDGSGGHAAAIALDITVGAPPAVASFTPIAFKSFMTMEEAVDCCLHDKGLRDMAKASLARLGEASAAALKLMEEGE